MGEASQLPVATLRFNVTEMVKTLIVEVINVNIFTMSIVSLRYCMLATRGTSHNLFGFCYKLGHSHRVTSQFLHVARIVFM